MLKKHIGSIVAAMNGRCATQKTLETNKIWGVSVKPDDEYQNSTPVFYIHFEDSKAWMGNLQINKVALS